MNGTNKGLDYGLVTLEIQGPPLMPPGLNGNGRTLPGRRGVAANATWQSNVCLYALIKQHHTGTVGTDCGPDGEPWPATRWRRQPVCQVGFVVATREMPHGRKKEKGGGGAN